MPVKRRARLVLGSALRALVGRHTNTVLAGDDGAVTHPSITQAMQDFRKVRAWQANRELTVMIYRISASFPREERFGLISQMRDAAVSVGANIAEGCGRGSNADTLRFFQISFASAVELLHHLITARDLEYLTEEQFAELEAKLESVRRMTAAFMSRLRES